MIRHILRKDFRLLWPFAVTMAVVPFALAAVDLLRGFQLEDPTLSSLLLLLEVVFYFGGGCLILTLIHEDSLVGVRQDWLARPIYRRDLLIAKLLFVLTVVQLPLLVADILEGLADGFAFGHAWLPALSQNLWLLLAFTLPVMAVASLTKSMTEAVASSVFLFVSVMCWALFLKGLTGSNPLGSAGDTSVGWIPGALRLLIYLVASSGILALQYFHRRTRTSRVVLGIALLTCLLTNMIPWQTAFHWETAVSRSHKAANSVTVSFDASRGSFGAPGHMEEVPNIHGAAFSTGRSNPVLHIPLQFRGMPANSMLEVDHAVVYIKAPGAEGRILLSTPTDPGNFEVSDNTPVGDVSRAQYEMIRVQPSVYSRMKDLPVTLDIEYSVTLLDLSSAYEMPTVGASQHLSGIGWCQTRLDEDQTRVEVGCLQDGHPPQCMTAFLENPGTTQRNPEIHGCLNDYVPWFGRYKPLNTITVAGADLVFRDPSDLVHYPVNASQIADSVVMIRGYEPAAHFTRRLIVPGIRLSSWAE